MRDGRGTPYPHDGAPQAAEPPAPTRTTRRARRPACEVPAPTCSYTYARFYACGWRCSRHAPWALLGLDEPQPGPGWPIHRQPPPDTTAPDTATQ